MLVIPRFFRVNPSLRQFKFLLQNLSTYARNPYNRIVNLLKELHPSAVVDVGANVGQFGIDLRRNGYEGRICSFEPIPSIFDDLINTSKHFQPWDCHNFGIGDDNLELEINVSRNDALSSSFLPMNPKHREYFPGSDFIKTEIASVKTLDSILPHLNLDLSRTLLKIDAQGFESKVIRGANRSLKFIPFCFLEVSLIQMYEGESSLIQILNQLSAYGHEVIDIYPGSSDSNGTLIQFDFLTSKFSGT